MKILLTALASILFFTTAIGQNQQTGRITGRILDQTRGEPMIGTTIAIKGSNKGAIADVHGDFVIDQVAPGNCTLLLSYVGFENKALENIQVQNGNVDLVEIYLEDQAVKLNEVTVSPGSFSVMGAQKIASQTLKAKDIKNMTWAEDLTRAVTRLPGVASNEFSSKFTVRGGENDEVLMVLDGMELYEPFHQRDFGGGLFSIIDIETVNSVDLLTGGFSAEHGQRQSGVFQMKTKNIQDNESHSSVGFSMTTARIYTDGNFADNRGKYMFSVRRGVLDIFNSLRLDAIPTFYDALAKFDYKLNDKNYLSFHNLYSGDKAKIEGSDPDNFDRNNTQFTNNYTWLTLKSELSPIVFVQSMLYGGYISHDRNGAFHKRDFTDKGDFALSDKRRYTYAGAKQDWTIDFSNKFALKTGFDFRQLNADYNYSHSLTEIRVTQENTEGDSLYIFSRNIDLVTKPSGQLINVYVSGKALITEKLIAEAGFRYDRASYAGDNLFSPRFGLSYSFSDRTFLRAAWGQYYQSQFINNLDVNHNGTQFNPAELSTHYVVGLQHRFKNKISFRLEAYYKDISRISPIYENLRDPWETFPEQRNDVIKLNIANGSSKGIEFFLKYDVGEKLSWWFSYALARAEENITSLEFDGIYEPQLGKLRRPFNQTHTIYADVNYRFNPKWHVNLSFQFYNGQPRTDYNYLWQKLPADNQLGQESLAVLGEGGDLQFYQEHGVYRGKDYPAYYKADIRVNRVFQLKSSRITAYAHVINFTNHLNVRKFDRGVVDDNEQLIRTSDGGYKVTTDPDPWFGLTPVVGMSWEF